MQPGPCAITNTRSILGSGCCRDPPWRQDFQTTCHSASSWAGIDCTSRKLLAHSVCTAADLFRYSVYRCRPAADLDVGGPRTKLVWPSARVGTCFKPLRSTCYLRTLQRPEFNGPPSSIKFAQPCRKLATQLHLAATWVLQLRIFGNIFLGLCN